MDSKIELFSYYGIINQYEVRKQKVKEANKKLYEIHKFVSVI